MAPEVMLAGVLAVVLCAYVVTGGADFGGGVWDLLARGPRAADQRRAIARTIGPIWEANHVWLIVALVILFVAFPKAYAAIGTALHIPITMLLVGIVLRGSTFVFRAYDDRDDVVQRRWSVIFAVSSTVTPVMLGVVVGAIASGDISVIDGVVQTDFISAWLAPFPWVVGLLTLAIFAFLSAVYLTRMTTDELQEDFRRRGLLAAAAVFVLAWTAFFASRTGAPAVWDGLWASSWAIPFQVVVALVGMGCITTLYLRRFMLSRNLAIVQVLLVVGGWTAAQYPYVIPPSILVSDASHPDVLWMLLICLGVGAGPLALAYGWLLRVFTMDEVSGLPRVHDD